MTARAVDEAVAALAARQHGAFSRDQARAAGATAKIVRVRRENGTWIERCQDVFQLRGSIDTWRSRLWVAVLGAPDGTAVSHDAAAALHGMTTFQPGPVVVTVPHATTRLVTVAVVHQSRRLYSEHCTSLDGLRVTSVERTLIDLAAVLSRSRAAWVLDEAIASRKAQLVRVCATFDDLACRGRRGTRAMRALLAERSPGYVPPTSKLESLFLQLLRQGGLPRPILQFPHPSPAMEGKIVDAAYVEHRILIELDSRRWHDRSPRDHERDRERDVEARRVGWDPYRFTYRNVTEQGDWVVGVLRDARRIAA